MLASRGGSHFPAAPAQPSGGLGTAGLQPRGHPSLPAPSLFVLLPALLPRNVPTSSIIPEHQPGLPDAEAALWGNGPGFLPDAAASQRERPHGSQGTARDTSQDKALRVKPTQCPYCHPDPPQTRLLKPGDTDATTSPTSALPLGEAFLLPHPSLAQVVVTVRQSPHFTQKLRTRQRGPQTQGPRGRLHSRPRGHPPTQTPNTQAPGPMARTQ